MQHRGVTRWIACMLTAAMVLGGLPVSPITEAQAKDKTETLSYKGYTKVWEDNFEGDSLNMKDWNIETHEPGWVNAELQEYTESGNYTVKDGTLTIIPKKTQNADGTYSYSSARINTQNKHDFKYGIMEAKMKFPKGQGYLPAFWMMPTDENFYGQWPKCGEIDIAEVMGQDTKKLYGTIHYGEPHAQSQGTEVLKKGDFSDEWHTCAVEWEPGSIKWYVDGRLYHEEHSWYSKTTGQGEVTYPAPFDQNFYLILNLAVGGSWVGYPDETTSFDSNFQVDYVRVYQKKNYNENVKKPVKKVVLKKADKNGNYVSNASFAKNEKLDGSANWQFLEAQSGVGSAAIQDKNIVISTKNAGKEDYSIQLVQPGLPMEKGAVYEVSFDAYAAEKRTMKVDISGPDMNYMRYFQDTTVNLTTKKKSYKYTFTMAEDTDANSRLEFNLGAQGSTADVHITNVKVTKTKSASKADNNKKTVLADGNLVYNGKFQEGTNRLGFWKVTKKNASVSVTNKNYNKRQLAVKIKKATKASDIKVYQKDLAFEKNKEYSVSFDAAATTARTIKVKVAGKTLTAKLTPSTTQYRFIVKTGKKLSDKNIVFYLGGKKGTVTLDNVVVTENSLIKNGSFNAGTTGWTEWHEANEADVSYVIDSLSEDNAADFTIKKTGSEDWKIQLMQKNVPLVKDQYYKLTFKAKSSKNRQIRAIMQGLEDKNWEVYSGENIVDLTSEYQNYTKVFRMTAESDPATQLSFNLGAVAGKVIDEQHRVCIDDVNLEVISEEEAKKILGEGPKTQDTMIKDGTFVKGMEQWSEWHEAAEADAQYETANNEIHFTVNKTGSEDWKIQLKQENIKLEKDHYYKLVFDGKSDLERKVRATLQGGESRGYTHYAGEYFVTLGKDYQTYEHVFKMNESTDDKTSFQICMGAVGSSINKTHNMYFKDFSLEEISEEEGKKLVKNVSAGGGGGSAGSGSAGNGGSSVTTPEGNKTLVTAAAANHADSWNTSGATVTNGAGDDAGKVVAALSGANGTITCKQAFSVAGLKKVDTTIQLKADTNMTVKVGLKPQTVLRQTQKRNAQLMSRSRFRLMDTESSVSDGAAFIGTTKEVQLKAGEAVNVPLRVDIPANTGELVFAMEISNASENANLTFSDLSIKDANMLAAADAMNNSSAWELVQTEGGSASLTSNTKGDTYEVDIRSVGTSQDYSICVKQNHLKLKKDTAYKITFQAKSTVARHFETNVMDPDNGYAWFGGATDKDLTTEYKTFTVDIPKNRDSNYDCSTAMLQFSLGYFKDYADACAPSVVTIRDLYMEEAEGSDISANAPEPIVIPGTNLLKNADFEADNGVAAEWEFGVAENQGIVAGISYDNGSAIVKIDNLGTATDKYVDWQIALKQAMNFKKGHRYQMQYTISSTIDRQIKVDLISDDAPIEKGRYDYQMQTIHAAPQTFDATVTCTADTDVSGFFRICMGKIKETDAESTTEPSTITISGLKVVDLDAEKESENPGTSGGTTTEPDLNESNENLFANWKFEHTEQEPLYKTWNCFGCGDQSAGVGTTYGFSWENNYAYHATIKSTGGANWHVMLQQTGLTLPAGTYQISFEMMSTKARHVQFQIGLDDKKQYSAEFAIPESKSAEEGQWVTCEKSDITFEDGLENGSFELLLGKYEEDGDLGEHDIRVKNIKLVRVS